MSSIHEAAIITTILLRQLMEVDVLASKSCLSSFDIYDLTGSTNLIVLVQLVLTYLVSVIHLMDWNTLVSVFIFLSLLIIVFLFE